MIKRVLVANRSEIALRIIRSLKEMNIESVITYSEADRFSLAVELADQSICIGPAPAKDSYLFYQRILSAALSTHCDAIHPGYGFLAENPHFAEACEALGLTFIGPSARTIRSMGNKTMAIDMMRNASIPVIPGSDGNSRSDDELILAADQVGYPLMIKAVGGGGGRGMRIVHQKENLLSSHRQAVIEAESAFSDSRVYLEKFLPNTKHLEVQVLLDQFGKGVHLFERDCSIQRKHQKLIEESPSTILDESAREALCSSAMNAVQSLSYHSTGTVEFLWDIDHQEFFFMEMNTRIQVEHPVSEMITGVDLIRWQLEVAQNVPLPFSQEAIRAKGHAIECRINAEDHRQGFRPVPGRITRLSLPGGPGIRVDTAYECGSVIPPHYDSLLAKIICWGENRDHAIKRMKRALHELKIEGIPTTVPVCQWILNQQAFTSGDYTTRFLDDHHEEVSRV